LQFSDRQLQISNRIGYTTNAKNFNFNPELPGNGKFSAPIVVLVD